MIGYTTTYEKLQGLLDAYQNGTCPRFALRKTHTALWLLAWSATLEQQNAWPDVESSHIMCRAPQEILAALSVYRHARVSGAQLAGAVAHLVHGGDEALPRTVWEPLLRTTERLFVACVDVPRLAVPDDDAPALNCLSDTELKLALEAPDVRKAALALYYRREMRCHEHARAGQEASFVQRCRPPHIVHAARHVLLHGALPALRASRHYDIFVLAQASCCMLGQHGLDFAQRVLRFEAELSVPWLHHKPFPLVVERRRSWCLMWNGQCSAPASLPRILSQWKALVLHHDLNPIDSRHDIMAV